MDEASALPDSAPLLPRRDVGFLPLLESLVEPEQVLRLAGLAGPGGVESLLHHLPVGIVLAAAPSGRILASNGAGRELLGIVPAASNDGELRALRLDGSPHGSDGWPLVRAVRSGERVDAEEIVVARGDGTRRILRVSATPIRDAAGTVVLGIATIHDVTVAHHHLERERFLGEAGDILSASLDYRTTVQRLAELCVRSLAQYCLVHVEHKGEIRALGIASSGPIPVEEAREALRLLPVDPLGDHPVAEALRSGEPQLFTELPVERLTGNAPDAERVLSLSGLASALVVPLRAPGRTLGAITLARTDAVPPYGPADVELVEALARRAAHAVDNARLYREARHAVRARDEMLGVVSHDLRNSLHAALMNAELLLEIAPAAAPGSASWRRIAAIQRSLRHMSHLVRDLLEVNRIGRGSLPVQLERLEPCRLVAEIAEIFGSMAGEGGVRLEMRVPDSVPPVLADPGRVTQVLTNLVSNALHATPAGGAIEVAVEPGPGDWVRFRVSDTGAGMPREELDRVFDRFFQGSAARRSGIGLGLTIARGIVEAHGGRIWAESSTGQGSTFSFTLPRARE